MPQENIRSMSGFICDKEVRKCSVNQVSVSLLVSGFPITCAADDAYFSIDTSL